MLDLIKIGIRNLGECDAFYLLPGDMPAIHANTFIRVREAMEDSHSQIVSPTMEGFRKHPPLISANCVEEILNFSAEGGLRELWKQMDSTSSCISVDNMGFFLFMAR